MPRPLRLEFEGAWYHVMNRGAAHQTIFKNNTHRTLFLNLLTEANTYYGIQCHAYCLMDNHYHLLIHTPESNLSTAMRHINGVYTQQYNRLEKRDGPLFRGRYKAIVVDADPYLLCVSRYIHLNPVSAKMVTKPEHYEWSSYLAYINESITYPWLQTDFLLGICSDKRDKSAYKDFVNGGLDKETKIFYEMKKPPVIFGQETFKEEKLQKLPEFKIKHSKPDYTRTRIAPSLSKINEVCAQYLKAEKESLLFYQLGRANKPRQIAMYLARAIGKKSLDEIAKYFNCKSKSGASNAVSKIKQALKNDNRLSQQLQELETLCRGQVSP